MLCDLTLALPVALALGFCPDDTISGYSEPGIVWQLREIDGEPFAADATIAFPEEGNVTGTGPCNSYRASQSVPYPWIAISDIAATRMACDDLDWEAVFFETLQAMTLVEVRNDVLLLTNSDGREMFFKADAP